MVCNNSTTRRTSLHIGFLKYMAPYLEVLYIEPNNTQYFPRVYLKISYNILETAPALTCFYQQLNNIAAVHLGVYSMYNPATNSSY